MKWFRHDADANQDAKLKRLRMKYGLEGYGLYWYCIELITGNVDESNLTFELEHDAEIIAFDTGIHYERVQEMMSHMVSLGLFENTSGAITCMKLAKRLDQSMTSNPRMRKMISAIKDGNLTKSDDSHDEISESSCKKRLEVEETRQDLNPYCESSDSPKQVEQDEKPKKRKTKQAMPDDFAPNETNARIASELGVDLQNEVLKFSDHHGAKGSKFVDWNLALNTWLRNAAKFSQQRSGGRQPMKTSFENADYSGYDTSEPDWLGGGNGQA